MEHGKFFWNELATTDKQAAQKFYGEVIGWETTTMPMVGGDSYVIWLKDGENCGGLLQMDGPQFEGVPPHWMSYIAVDDVDARLEKVTAAGGKIIQPAFDIPNVGRMAVISDPQGAVVSLMTPSPSADD